MKRPKINIALVTMLTVSPLIFSGCLNFSSSNTAATQTVTADQTNRLYETPEFIVKFPKVWDLIEKKNFTSDVPQETVVVFRNNVKNEDFTANVNVVRNSLQNTKETLEYAKEVIQRQLTGLYDYKELKRDSTKMNIGGKQVDTYFVEFEAKKDLTDQPARFIQTFAVKGNNGYIIMGAVSTKEDPNVQKTVEDIVKSFTIK
jgi:hypothetical protein